MLSNLCVALTACASLAQVQSDDLSTVTSYKQSDIAKLSLASSYDPNANLSQVSTWISSIKEDGTWADVDYTSGCSAPRTTWFAEAHWARILGLAQAWSGLNSAAPSDLKNSTRAFQVATKALDYWFNNDYNNTACLVNGGTGKCPCGTPGLWNPNWFFQGIGVPTLASESCLLLYTGALTDHQRTNCVQLGLRGSTFSADQVLGPSYQTGANLINMLQDVISTALYSRNASLLTTAYSQVMSTFCFEDGAGLDGTHRDGSFIQHTGQIYNGAYGREVLRSFIQVQTEAEGTQYTANDTIQGAIATLIRASDWQIFTGADGKLYWDISSLGRYIASPLSDHLANNGLNFDVNDLANAVESFSSDNDVSSTIKRLQQASDAVPLSGNKAFWAADYMVHRRKGFTLFNKMISTRSQNSELVNGANPLGYHVNQGMLWSWTTGGEYQDLTGVWDWYLIPGTTVLYHYPALDPKWIAVHGKKNYVGVLSDGTSGFSVMDYVDPHDGSISYKRAWFYLDDMVLNVIVNATSYASAPIVTVLDQRLADGSALQLDGHAAPSNNVNNTAVKTIFYGGKGYFSDQMFDLSSNLGPKTGNWSQISITNAGVVTKDVFLAYHSMQNGSSFSYGFLPSSDAATLASTVANPPLITVNSTSVLAAVGADYAMVSFWPGAALSFSTDWPAAGTLNIVSSAPSAVILKLSESTMTVYLSDPTQALTQVTLEISTSQRILACVASDMTCNAQSGTVRLQFDLPQGGFAGSSTSAKISMKAM